MARVKAGPFQRELSEVKARINRLIPVIEDGKADGAIPERLRQLEDGHRDIQAEIRALEEERFAAAGGMKGIEFFLLLRELIKNFGRHTAIRYHSGLGGTVTFGC